MSSYTTQLRWWVETNSKGIIIIDEKIAAVRTTLFNFQYPFPDQQRVEFECDWIRHFYTQEICAETFGLWRLFLEDKFRTIMPYYNKLLITQTQIGDIYTNQKSTKTDTINENDNRKITGHDENETNRTLGNMTKIYEVPSKNVASIDDYLNRAEQTSGNDKNTFKDDNNTTDDLKRTGNNLYVTTGFSNASPSKLLSEFYATYRNIEKDIFNECEDLFMGIW